MKYFIEVRETRWDEWELFNDRARLLKSEFTNKKKAIQAKNRLRRWRDAENGLREAEGSNERNRQEFRVVTENGEEV